MKSPQDDLERDEATWRQRRWSRVDSETLLWLTAVPVWDDRLAARCSFPAGSYPDVRTMVRSLHQVKLLERIVTLHGDGTDLERFWLATPRRTDAAAAIRARPVRMNPVAELQRLAQRVAASADGGTSEVTRVWAELAQPIADLEGGRVVGLTAEQAIEQVSESLVQRVRELCRDGQVAEASNVVEAGAALGVLLGFPVEAAVDRARRRIERAYRTIADDRYLSRSLPRDEQIDALVRLLGDDGPNALHLVGIGGVGKTMLVRYLQSRLSFDKCYRGRPLAVGRVDFDLLHPTLVWDQPGALLAEFAEELAAYASTATAEELRDRLGRTVEAQASAASRDRALSADGTASAAFEPVLDCFIDYCRALDGRPVLVFDTCEELAKYHPPGLPIEAIERTFLLANAVLARDRELRVVFAGRRLLSTQYANWRIDPRDELPAGIVAMTPRPDVELHHVVGFDEEDVARLLHEVRDLDVAAATRRRLMASAVDVGSVQGLGEPLRDRANPFDVDLFANLLADAPSGQHDDVAFDLDLYVERRIVGRMEDADVAAILPAAALLGDFDREMIKPLLTTVADAEDTVRRLREQEWIDLRRGLGERTVISVELGLRPKLRRYYERRGGLDRVRDVLRPGLIELVRGSRLAALPVDHLVWALRLVPPDDGAALLDDVQGRAEAESGWRLIEETAAVLLATDDEGQRDAASIPLERQLRAGSIAAVRRRGDDHLARAAWSSIDRSMSPSAPVMSVGATPDTLTQRGQLGTYTQTVRIEGGGSLPGRQQLESLTVLLRARPSKDAVSLVAGLIAAIEVAVEAEASADPWVPGHPEVLVPAERILDLVHHLGRDLHPTPRAAALALAARTMLLTGASPRSPGETPEELFSAAEAAAGEIASRFSSPDWDPPADPLARVRLEWLLAAFHGVVPLPPNRADWWGDEPGSVDGDRLWALLRLLALDDDPTLVLERTDELAPDPDIPPPACAAHRRVPPAVIVDALVRSVRGDPGAALQQLEDVIQVNDRTRRVAPGLAEADRALTIHESYAAALGVIRYWRLDQHGILQQAARRPGLLVETAWTASMVSTRSELSLLRLPNAAIEVAEAMLGDGALLEPGFAARNGLSALEDVELRCLGLLAEATAPNMAGAIPARMRLSDLERLERLMVLERQRDTLGPDLSRLPMPRRPGRNARLHLAAAELIGPRDPALCAALLTDTTDAADPVHALAAALLSVVSARRLGVIPGMTTSDLVARYEAIAPERVTPDGKLVAGPPPPPADRWERRLRIVLDGEGKDTIRSTVSASGVVPAELEVVPAGNQPAARRAAVERVAIGVGAALLGLVLALALLVAVAFAWRNTVGRVWVASGWADTFSQMAVVYLVFLLGRWWWTRRRRRRGWRVLQTTVHVAPDGREHVKVDARLAAVVLGSPSAMAGVAERILATICRGIPPFVATGRVSLDRERDGALDPDMRATVGRARAARTVGLLVSTELSERPWERWRIGTATASRRHHYRTYYTLSRPLLTVGPAVAVLAARSWHSMADRAWPDRAVTLAVQPDQLPDLDGAIAHLIGIPVRTDAGWCLLVEQRRPAIAKDRRVGRPSHLDVPIRPDELAVGGSPLVVLQGRPGVGVAGEVELAGMRALGDALVAAGAAAVLVIPSLPSAVATLCVQQVADAVAVGAPCRLRTLLDLAADLRRLVEGDHEAGTAFAAEVAVHVGAGEYGVLGAAPLHWWDLARLVGEKR